MTQWRELEHLCRSHTLTALQMRNHEHEVRWIAVEDGNARCNVCIVAQPALWWTPVANVARGVGLKQEIDTIPTLRKHEDKKQNSHFSEETQRVLNCAVLPAFVAPWTRILASGLTSKSPNDPTWG